MTSQLQNPNQQPVKWRAKRSFSTEDKRITLDKGDIISPEEFESLWFDEQDAFEPLFKKQEERRKKKGKIF